MTKLLGVHVEREGGDIIARRDGVEYTFEFREVQQPGHPTQVSPDYRRELRQVKTVVSDYGDTEKKAEDAYGISKGSKHYAPGIIWAAVGGFILDE